RLVPRSRRSRDVFAVMDHVRDEATTAIPRLHIEFMQILADVINDLAGAARPVEVKLFGESLDTLEAYARRLAPNLEQVGGLEDLYNGVSEPSAELLMRVNEAEAGRIGMTPVDVGSAVSAALLGMPAGEIRTGDRPVAGRVLAAHPAPPGVRVALGGQYAGQQEAFRALLLVLGLAAVSVCAVMVVQFESFVEPLVVLLVAPVSFVGALALLFLTGTPLNVSS